MLFVPKIKLVVSIAFTAFLTSIFLMFQLCLLESGCYSGLSRMAASHKRAMYSMTGNWDPGKVPDSVIYTSSPTTNPSHSISTSEIRVSEVFQSKEKIISREALNKVMETNVTLTSSNSPSSSYKAVSKPTRPIPTTPQSPSPSYIVISKSAYTMSKKFFNNPKVSCRQPSCMEYLSSFDRAYFDYCTQKKHRGSGKAKNMVKIQWKPKGECRFMRGEGRAPVALTSLPGSGNTWVRGLLEKATGICTGSVYCDSQLREAGFNGEEIRSGSVLVVKTHKAEFTWTDTSLPKYTRKGVPSYGAVILLLRNPYHALIAERNRKEGQKVKMSGSGNKSSGHIVSVGAEKFGVNPEWNAFVKAKMLKWRTYIENVILHPPPNVPKLVVRYEDFQRDRVREVSRVLDFLHFPHSLETLSQRLEEDFSVFHRKRHPQFQAFTPSQELFIDRSLRSILNYLSESPGRDTYGIENYIRNNKTLSLL